MFNAPSALLVARAVTGRPAASHRPEALLAQLRPATSAAPVGFRNSPRTSPAGRP